VIVFIILACLGFFFLVLSLILGEIFDFAHEVAIEHDISIDHDGDMGGPSVFSSRIISAFITGFGASGAIASYYGRSWIVSSLIGLCFGLVAAGIVYAVVSVMYRQQAGSGVSLAEMVGMSATVSVAIPREGFGQITLIIKGSQVEHFARSADGESIKHGVSVKIEKFVGDRFIVSPIEKA
jgi:hypothetical protein